MSSNYRATLAAHVRLCILRLLTEAPEYEGNSSIIADSVALYGLKVSRDFVDTELVWLEEQGLVHLDKVGATLHVARLTNRGADVAEGRASVPGVKKRGPGD